MLIDPDQVDVGVLVVGDRLADGQRHHGHKREDDPPLGAGERRMDRRGAGGAAVRRQVAITHEIGRQAHEHQHTRQGESDVPAVKLGQQAAGEGPGHSTDIDADGEDREPAGAADAVVGPVEPADLGGDVALQQAAADDEQGQGDQERSVEGHGQVAGAHQHRAEHHRMTPPQPTVGDQAAQHRGEIDEGAVEPVDL